MDKTEVYLDNLGICRNCKEVVSLVEIVDKITPYLRCPFCGRVVWDWGYGLPDDATDERYENKRIEWVGPSGDWVNERPEKNFTLGRFRVIV